MNEVIMTKADKYRMWSAGFLILSWVLLALSFGDFSPRQIDLFGKGYLLWFSMSILFRLEALEVDTGFTRDKWFKDKE
jgi:hypothetical protein